MKVAKLNAKLHHRLNSKYSKNLYNHHRLGGDAIGSGTYGCVFRPPLHCENPVDTPDTSKYISKFMLKDEIIDELSEMRTIKNILLESKSLQFIEKYYILANDEDVCAITLDLKSKYGKQNIKDLESGLFGDKANCEHIYSSIDYVKKNIDKYGVLNLLDGGTDLFNFIDNTRFTKDTFTKLNNSLIDVLKNGIVEMNKLGIYHCDLKPGNLVYNNNNVRIIDWGMASIINTPITSLNLNSNINKIKLNGILYYGMPFSNVIITEPNNFKKILKKYNTPDKYKTYLKKKYKNKAELKYLTSLDSFNKKFNKDSKKTLSDIITDNLVDIVYSGESFENYIKNVYFPNADVFAFLQIYIYILEKLNTQKHFDTLKENIKLLINKYLLTSDYATKPYPLDIIVSDLKSLTGSYKSSVKKSSVKKKLKLKKKSSVKKTSVKKSSVKKSSVKKSSVKKDCKGLTEIECNKLENCIYARGSKRNFCRTKKNKKIKSN